MMIVMIEDGDDDDDDDDGDTNNSWSEAYNPEFGVICFCSWSIESI